MRFSRKGYKRSWLFNGFKELNGNDLWAIEIAATNYKVRLRGLKEQPK